MLDKEFSVKTVLVLSLIAVAVISVLGYISIGPTQLYNVTTMEITLALCGLLLAVLVKSDETLFPMFALLTTFFLLFIFTRVLSFLYIPERAHFPLSINLSAQQMNSGYAYIALGTAALCAGFFLAYMVFKNFLRKRSAGGIPVKVYRLSHLALIFAVICAVQLYVVVWIGDSVLGDMYYGVTNKFVGGISVLFCSVQALLVVVISTLASRKESRGGAIALLLFIGVFVSVSVMLGSRAGGILVGQTVLVAMLVLYENFRERLRNYMIFLLAIAVLSVISFPIATAVRTVMLAERESFAATNDTHPKHHEFVMNEELGGQPKMPGVSEAAGGSMLSRLGAAFDTAVITASLDADQEMLSRTMNLSYALKSAVNIMVPGVVFAEAQVNTALLWPFIYKLRDSHLLKPGYYESFLWTPWGLAYSMFGWGAGLFALLMAGFILQAVYMATAGGLRGSGWQPYFSAWILLGTFSFYSSMGLDDWLVGLQRSLFSLILVLFGLWGCEVVGRVRFFARRGGNE